MVKTSPLPLSEGYIKFQFLFKSGLDLSVRFELYSNIYSSFVLALEELSVETFDTLIG